VPQSTPTAPPQNTPPAPPPVVREDAQPSHKPVAAHPPRERRSRTPSSSAAPAKNAPTPAGNNGAPIVD
jgi:hypothetical protein